MSARDVLKCSNCENPAVKSITFAETKRGKEKTVRDIKEYLQKPGVKEHRQEWHKEYSQKPEVKARIKAHRQSPEAKARAKAHHERPDVKARIKAYHKKPNFIKSHQLQNGVIT